MTFKKTAETLPKGAHTLERDYYVNPSILQREYHNIFFKNWVCVGRSSELTEVGQYKLINIDTESVIVLREKNGNLKAYFNVCRHRGTRICEKVAGQFSKSIQCGYHGWTYGLDGRLIGAPHMDAVEGFKKDDYPLHSIALAEWEGFIFVNMSNNPNNFDTAFAPLFNRFSNWNISDLVVQETKEYIVKGNWKLVIQNYCECYHCPILHPDLAA
ncbi:MAG: aromatic ring-hydroxylating dioxygenase subunit alpha, partial [Candidatus Marinimicrobia bacterium]|nr:aromatic ring-hydroxylating dioxygenase subunit alpha [Candidatus Neomarinimicrobiota bacterium]MBT5747714.1 aromatic ring-hydroxylating dioxygenase subunit alpha [Candidatus Neomarinimicrobiota bacterium]MBT7515243.1 aromatic ring-hydroxylating dioxygenase subunit alpha [Candidatus Neomarinimicrobiota bacterium]MBT7945125.1 aromatic ring-hydroxylating dioxygenase subunit alpha [Candidatus Neomarinimicrobiota bacterium]